MLVLVAAMTLTGLPHPKLSQSQPALLDPGILQLRSEALRYRKALQYRQVAETCERGAHLALAQGDLTSAVKFLNNAGAAQLAIFNPQAAFDAFLQAKALAETQRDGQAISAVAFNLASVYLQANNLPAADHIAAQGLKAAGNIDPFGYRSRLLLILAVLRREQNKAAEALTYVREAIDAADAIGNQSDVARAWVCLGDMRLASGDVAGAAGPFEEGFRLRLLSKDSDLRGSYFTLSKLRLAQGDPGSAATLLDRATDPPSKEVSFPVWSVYGLRGAILQAQHRPAEALDYFKKALDAWQSSGLDLAPSDALRTSSSGFRDVTSVFGSLIQTSLALKPEPNLDAFVAVEEYRAVAMRQTMAAPPGWRQSVSPQYWQAVDQLRKAQASQLGHSSPTTQATIEGLQQTLAEHQLRAGLSLYRTSSNKTNERSTAVEALRGIQRALTPEETLVSLYLGDPVSAVWAVTQQHIECHRLPSMKVLSEAASRFRKAVELDSGDRDGRGEELYRQLFGGLSAEVDRKPFWLIAASDQLFDIPVAALVTGMNKGKPVYLVEKHATERIPSALMLRNSVEPFSNGGFLGVADGIYNIADPRWRPNTSNRRWFGIPMPASKLRAAFELPRLAGSAHEIQACAQVWNGSRPPVLLTGRKASPDNFRSDLRDRPAVIHLAAHVLSPADHPEHVAMDPDQSQRAVIDFGLSPLGEPEVLTYSDIVNLDVRGATVIVNGCASSNAGAALGGGVMGLTRAWLLAGAQTVVGSRWPIPDDTGDLFQALYSNWTGSRAGVPRKRIVAESLQQAQLAVLHANTWRSNPKYWSAFYIMGKD